VARTSPDIQFSGVTVLTPDEDGAIVHIANPLNSRKNELLSLVQLYRSLGGG